MEKRFFKNVKFNACKVYKELHQIVADHGGYYCSDWEKSRQMFEVHRFDESKKPEVIFTNFIDWYAFILDDNYYYVEFKDNPFFESHFTKAPVLSGGKVSRNYYADSNKLPSYFDWELLSNEEAKEIASELFKLLINADYNEHYREYERKRVPNYYDGGYHYERVAKPERFEKMHEVELMGE